MKFDINLLWVVVCALVVCIPLAIKLVKVTKQSVENKNWDRIMVVLIDLMQSAEELIKTGADKKAYVLTMLENISEQIDYPLTDSDWKKISDLIDALVDLSDHINVPEQEVIEEDITI